MRLRQVVLAAPDLQPIADRIQQHLGLPDPFADPGVAEFGLHNAVFEVGDTFLEVISPTRPDTAAGRYLERRGTPEAAGYMVIFQTDDIAAARARAAANGARIVWQADLPDIAGTHLHPTDVPGAIVSVDWADPPESWHWAGPRWRGGAPHDAGPTAITGVTIAVPDPAATLARWTAVLGPLPPPITFTATPERTLNADARIPRVSVQSSVQANAPADGVVGIRVGPPSGRPPLDLGTVRLTA